MCNTLELLFHSQVNVKNFRSQICAGWSQVMPSILHMYTAHSFEAQTFIVCKCGGFAQTLHQQVPHEVIRLSTGCLHVHIPATSRCACGASLLKLAFEFPWTGSFIDPILPLTWSYTLLIEQKPYRVTRKCSFDRVCAIWTAGSAAESQQPLAALDCAAFSHHSQGDLVRDALQKKIRRGSRLYVQYRIMQGLYCMLLKCIDTLCPLV